MWKLKLMRKYIFKKKWERVVKIVGRCWVQIGNVYKDLASIIVAVNERIEWNNFLLFYFFWVKGTTFY